jgi:acyl-coenzyme A synthetase/AMP-(fatty) acid ligase
MSSTAPRRTPARELYPLIGHESADAVIAWRGATPVTAGRFLAEVIHAAKALPQAGHVLNLCTDRYRFALALCAAVVRGQVTLLPPAATPHVIASMRAFAPDAYCIADDASLDLGVPRFELPVDAAPDTAFDVPRIPGEQVIACLFTSGSTGEPQPHPKRWASLVTDVAGEARRLDIGPGHAILGTVPPQHMYGFESTVMLPLVSGAALTADRPFLPAEIDAAVECVPAPRTLFITPFHLRAWLESGDCARVETIVSATAPLSQELARRAEALAADRLIEIYGSTETGQVATRETARTSEWHALEGIRIRSEGERAVASGAHIDEPMPLNDVIEILGDGSRFLLHGRTADLVNIAGKRNSLGYLDRQLASIPGVQDAAFFVPGEEEVDGVTRLMAFAVAPGLTAAGILAALRERLDPAFLPRPLVLVQRLPRNLTGKIPRAALAALAAQSRKPPHGGA